MIARLLGSNRLAGHTLLALYLGLVGPPLAGGLQGAAAAPPAGDSQALLILGHQVFQQLLKSPEVTEAGGGLEWRFFLLSDQSVNAHSDAKGRVWVGGGLAQMLGQDRGLWAAVLSHEVGHVLLRHPSRGLAVLHTAFPYVFGKVLRDREHRADAAGMMLMARAGYHPDSLLALHHLLRAAHGERPGAVAFFGSHPRWQTREQRLESVRPEAVAAFQQAWPDAAASPGGTAPLVVFLGAASVSPGNPESARIRVPLSCRNAQGPVTVVVKMAAPGKTAKSGDVLLERSQDCPPEAESVTELEVGAEQLAGAPRTAWVEVMGADGALRARSRPFNVSP